MNKFEPTVKSELESESTSFESLSEIELTKLIGSFESEFITEDIEGKIESIVSGAEGLESFSDAEKKELKTTSALYTTVRVIPVAHMEFSLPCLQKHPKP
jgi:hypothetical protein